MANQTNIHFNGDKNGYRIFGIKVVESGTTSHSSQYDWFVEYDGFSSSSIKTRGDYLLISASGMSEDGGVVNVICPNDDRVKYRFICDFKVGSDSTIEDVSLDDSSSEVELEFTFQCIETKIESGDSSSSYTVTFMAGKVSDSYNYDLKYWCSDKDVFPFSAYTTIVTEKYKPSDNSADALAYTYKSTYMFKLREYKYGEKVPYINFYLVDENNHVWNVTKKIGEEVELPWYKVYGRKIQAKVEDLSESFSGSVICENPTFIQSSLGSVNTEFKFDFVGTDLKDIGYVASGNNIINFDWKNKDMGYVSGVFPETMIVPSSGGVLSYTNSLKPTQESINIKVQTYSAFSSSITINLLEKDIRVVEPYKFLINQSGYCSSTTISGESAAEFLNTQNNDSNLLSSIGGNNLSDSFVKYDPITRHYYYEKNPTTSIRSQTLRLLNKYPKLPSIPSMGNSITITQKGNESINPRTVKFTVINSLPNRIVKWQIHLVVKRSDGFDNEYLLSGKSISKSGGKTKVSFIVNDERCFDGEITLSGDNYTETIGIAIEDDSIITPEATPNEQITYLNDIGKTTRLSPINPPEEFDPGLGGIEQVPVEAYKTVQATVVMVTKNPTVAEDEPNYEIKFDKIV